MPKGVHLLHVAHNGHWDLLIILRHSPTSLDSWSLCDRNIPPPDMWIFVQIDSLPVVVGHPWPCRVLGNRVIIRQLLTVR